MADADVGRLDIGAAMGGGESGRMTWVAGADRPRTCTTAWPIAHFRWTPIGLTFTPEHSGTVTVSLMGPWMQDPSGVLYRQDVMWGAIRAEGAVVRNGDFELVNVNGPDHWTAPAGKDSLLETDGPPGSSGARCALVWHDRPLRQQVAVTGGTPVTIHAWVRARLPDGMADNPRIASHDTPAHAAAMRFRRGVNFSNYFDAPADQDWGGGPLGQADIDAVSAERFDHVRLTVRWNAHAGPAPAFTIEPAFFHAVDGIVTNLLAGGLNVIVDLHHFSDFADPPSAWTNLLFAIWDQVAAHYANQPAGLAFEILNEPNGSATTAVMNDLYASLLPRIRLTNPGRTVFVGPGGWNSIAELCALRLPADDENLIVTVHNYSPFLFTHQGASWGGPGVATTGIVYPGPPATPLAPHPSVSGFAWVASWIEGYNTLPADANPCGPLAFEAALALAGDWSTVYGRPVHLGEFGAYTTADTQSRVRFYRDMRRCAERNGIGWALWDWKAGFNYWDREAGSPVPGMHEALFGP